MADCFYNGWLFQRTLLIADGCYNGRRLQRIVVIADGCYNAVMADVIYSVWLLQ